MLNMPRTSCDFHYVCYGCILWYVQKLATCDVGAGSERSLSLTLSLYFSRLSIILPNNVAALLTNFAL